MGTVSLYYESYCFESIFLETPKWRPRKGSQGAAHRARQQDGGQTCYLRRVHHAGPGAFDADALGARNSSRGHCTSLFECLLGMIIVEPTAKASLNTKSDTKFALAAANHWVSLSFPFQRILLRRFLGASFPFGSLWICFFPNSRPASTNLTKTPRGHRRTEPLQAAQLLLESAEADENISFFWEPFSLDSDGLLLIVAPNSS